MRTQEARQDGTRGWIVNIGSVLSEVGTENAPSICASKGAVSALTRAVARDCAPFRIHVNAILPGCEYSRTGFKPLAQTAELMIKQMWLRRR